MWKLKLASVVIPWVIDADVFHKNKTLMFSLKIRIKTLYGNSENLILGRMAWELKTSYWLIIDQSLVTKFFRGEEAESLEKGTVFLCTYLGCCESVWDPTNKTCLLIERNKPGNIRLLLGVSTVCREEKILFVICLFCFVKENGW